MSECPVGNDYDGNLGTRISSIFVILVGSWAGAWFPVFAKRHRSMGVPEWAFFIAKYFGSGVIIATAFIHLLAPANEALGSECLADVLPEYPWPEGIALIVVFLMFFLELMAMRYANFGPDVKDLNPADLETSKLPMNIQPPPEKTAVESGERRHSHERRGSHIPGDNHLGHNCEHTDNEDVSSDWPEHGIVPETYSAQLTSIFILEFGVIFHSIFIGLTLAVAGDEFVTLYIVLVFHQTFEGLGLGSRLASLPWPKSKRWTPYILATAYGLTTPIAIAIGLGVRQTWSPESKNALLTNGFFDSISAGILIYTGLVELMAHEFMFSNEMRKAPIGVVLSAAFLMVLGAGLMALLGYWA